MNKLDKIGYIVKNTGEEISKEIYDTIVAEEFKKRFSELLCKFDKKTISKEEMLELMKYIKKKTEITLNYDTFYKVNLGKAKPEGISKSEYGDFFQLLNYLSYRNTLTHSNGKMLKYADIAKYLGFTAEKTLKNYIRKLIKNRMLAKTEMGGIDYLIINPAYAQRNMRLNSTIYKLFKEDLEPMLDKFQIRLLELEEDDTDVESIVAVDTKHI